MREGDARAMTRGRRHSPLLATGVHRTPYRTRKPTWPPGLARAVERLRLDDPMWGKLKLAPILRTQGFTVSEAMVGRILGALIARGIVAKASDLIRKVAARKAPKKRPHAIRKPGGVTLFL